MHLIMHRSVKFYHKKRNWDIDNLANFTARFAARNLLFMQMEVNRTAP